MLRASPVYRCQCPKAPADIGENAHCDALTEECLDGEDTNLTIAPGPVSTSVQLLLKPSHRISRYTSTKMVFKKITRTYL